MKLSFNKILAVASMMAISTACKDAISEQATPQDTNVVEVVDKPLTNDLEVKAGRISAEIQLNKVTNRYVSTGQWQDIFVLQNNTFDKSATYLARLYVYTANAQVDLYASDYIGGGWRILGQNTSNAFPQKEITFLLKSDTPETRIKVYGRAGINVKFDLAIYKLPVEKINYSTANSNQKTLGYGAIYGYIGNTAVYSNGSSYSSTYRNSVNGYDTGYKWQCVEFCRRFYYEYYNKKIGAGYNAKDFYANAYRWGMTSYANGGSTAPKPGDILCYNGNAGGGYGHVEIIVEVGTDYIIVARQNVYGDIHVGKRYTRTGNTINTSNVQGWIR